MKMFQEMKLAQRGSTVNMYKENVRHSGKSRSAFIPLDYRDFFHIRRDRP